MRTARFALAIVLGVAILGVCSAGEEEKTPDKPQLPGLRLDLKAKTVEFDGHFCMGEYPLELLVCQNTMRDYEAMISSPCEPSIFHTALLALGLKPRVRDDKEPGKILREGDPIDILIRFSREGKEVTVEPRDLIMNIDTKEHVAATPFVFFGSFLFPDPDDKERMIYLADAEDWLVGLLGDTASVVDLPPTAAGKYGALAIDPKVCPPKGTKATVIIRPARDRKPPEPAKDAK